VHIQMAQVTERVCNGKKKTNRINRKICTHIRHETSYSGR